MRINPAKYATTSEQKVKPKKVTAGQKLFAPIGVAYTKSSIKGTVCLNLYCIVLEDLEKDNNEGIIHTEKFWISERALWKIANWSVSMRFDAEFDCEDRDDIEKIIAHGQAFVGNVKVTDDGEYTRREIDSFIQPVQYYDNDGNIKLDVDKMKIVAQGEIAFPKLIESAKGYGTVFIDPMANRNVENAAQELNDDPFASSTTVRTTDEFDEIPF